MSQAGHGLNDPQEQQPLVIKLGDLKQNLWDGIPHTEDRTNQLTTATHYEWPDFQSILSTSSATQNFY